MVVSEGGLSHVRIPIGDHILTPELWQSQIQGWFNRNNC